MPGEGSMVIVDKRALRRRIGALKQAMTPARAEEASRRLARRFFETEQYRSARSIYAYMSFGREVDTRPIIERCFADGKRVAVPKIIDKQMVFIRIEDFGGLSEGAFGIPEPIRNTPVADDADALILIPGLAFDFRGHRVGYGGGYYDRYLASHPGHPTIALCFDYQMFDRLDAEAHDIPVDLVIADGS